MKAESYKCPRCDSGRFHIKTVDFFDEKSNFQSDKEAAICMDCDTLIKAVNKRD